MMAMSMDDVACQIVALAVRDAALAHDAWKQKDLMESFASSFIFRLTVISAVKLYFFKV